MKTRRSLQLTVLSVAYPFAPVGVDAVGGAEQVLCALDRALVAAGHTSLVAACEDSQVAGRLFAIPFPQRDLSQESDRQWSRTQMQAAIDRALLLHRVDLIHMHGLDFFAYEVPPSIPVLVTLHMPVEWYGAQRLENLRNRMHLICVSNSQRLRCPTGLRDLPVIPNGVALPPDSTQPKSDYALVLGRICPEKNAHEALEAGTLAHTRVLLGGRVFPYRQHQRYFHERVEPLLDDSGAEPRHEFVGALELAERRSLLVRAKCLLHPTLAPETSSLVAMEALAAGTPVIAYRSGALPEIIEDGVTGFLVNDREQMAEAIRNVHTLSSGACRKAAEERFSSRRMAERYFTLYHALGQRESDVASG